MKTHLSSGKNTITGYLLRQLVSVIFNEEDQKEIDAIRTKIFNHASDYEALKRSPYGYPKEIEILSPRVRTQLNVDGFKLSPTGTENYYKISW